MFLDHFRCIISGPRECGKTCLLQNLVIDSIYFDKLYILGPNCDQYEDKYKASSLIKDKVDSEFIKDIKDLRSASDLPENLKKLMIFVDVKAKESIIKDHFCDMVCLNQNLFSLDRQNVIENCNIFILFEQNCKKLR